MPHEGRLDCPRCGRAMLVGYMLEKGDSNAASVAAWVEGVPERSRWTGLKLKDRRVLPTETWRCKGCGYLESYAPEPGIE